MSNNANEYIKSHLNTKRATKCRPIQLQKGEDITGDLIHIHQCVINTPYPSEKIQPSLIKVGIKDQRVCIRVDEKQRIDRCNHKDYFTDDLSSMKKFMQHMGRLQHDYDRTTWFLRAQLIPSVFSKATELSQQMISY